MTELRRENRALRRQVLRQQRELAHYQHVPLDVELKPDTLATVEGEVVPAGDGCERCGAETRTMTLPSGTILRVCTACKTRKRI